MKLTFFYFWIAGLATYRLTVLIARDLGPFGIFRKLRSIDRCSKLLKCPYCVSIWSGTVACAALYFAGIREPISVWGLLVLAFSAISIALDRTFSADHQP